MHVLHYLLPVAIYVAGLCLLLALLAAFTPRSRNYLSRLLTLAEHLPKNRIEAFARYFDEDADAPADAVIYDATGRLRGTLRRVADLGWLVLILQNAVRQNPELRPRARRIYRLALVQLWFSGLAIPEAVLCALWQDIPHVAARWATATHIRITLRIQNLTVDEGTPACAGDLY